MASRATSRAADGVALSTPVTYCTTLLRPAKRGFPIYRRIFARHLPGSRSNARTTNCLYSMRAPPEIATVSGYGTGVSECFRQMGENVKLWWKLLSYSAACAFATKSTAVWFPTVCTAQNSQFQPAQPDSLLTKRAKVAACKRMRARLFDVIIWSKNGAVSDSANRALRLATASMLLRGRLRGPMARAINRHRSTPHIDGGKGFTGVRLGGLAPTPIYLTIDSGLRWQPPARKPRGLMLILIIHSQRL